MDAHVSNIERDGEIRRFAAHGEAVLASAGGLTVLRGVFEPGWRWSSDVKPIAGTDSCQTRHLGYVISGEMHTRMDDGTEQTVSAGDLFDLPPGHDAWVEGDEPAVVVDYASEATRYARPAAAQAPADDKYMTLVRRGYDAFNRGDVETLRTILARDCVQHVPGTGAVAGTYKGLDAVLGYYAKLGEITDGTFRAHLIDVFGDGQGHVTSLHQMSATRNGQHRTSRATILFTFLGDKATDLAEMHADLPGDDAFLS